LNILPLNKWLSLTENEPLIIAGPCSAESERQLYDTAFELSKNKLVKIFRAGIWKPRTRPNGFEGVGEKGLKWLAEIKSKTKLLTAVEVASPKHVELCLKYNIDILWIGARTTGNPFSIQEIADSLVGTDIPVMVKNPLNPDLKLWIGAIERLNQSGINRIIAIHRGFHTYNPQPYRNSPFWEIPIELKRIYENLPIINDPSHIAGSRDYIYEISQKAINLEMDGLMIEVHPTPDLALSDSNQQITPEQFNNLVKKLVFRSESNDELLQNQLTNLRTLIDELDDELIRILSKRMKLVSKIGEFKKEYGITILQIKRWNEIINDRLLKAEKLGLSKNFILNLLEVLHHESIQIQNDILNSDNTKK
jgi:chorismate mutase